MKKRINFYCLMFIISVGLGITVDFITGFDYFKLGFDEGRRDAGVNYGKVKAVKYNDVYVPLQTKAFGNENPYGQDSVYNEVTKEMEAVTYSGMTVQVSKDKVNSSVLSDWLKGGGSMLYSVGILGFWVIFFVAIRYVNRGDVFLDSVANYLIRAAIFLMIAYIGEWVITYADYIHAKEMVEIANYEVVPNFMYNNSNLYIAFGLLIISQVIKYGKELKEEQELTI